jgi:hypothetical protein
MSWRALLFAEGESHPPPIGINGTSDPVRLSGIGDPEGRKAQRLM